MDRYNKQNHTIEPVMNNHSVTQVRKDWLMNTWKHHEPEFFITFHWKSLPTRIEKVEDNIKIFKNMFCSKFHWRLTKRKVRSSRIPEFPQRVGFQHFHEVEELYIKDRRKLVFHTHTHLSNTKGYFRDAEHLKHFIDELVMDKKVRDMRKLRPEVSVKKWNHDHHQNYNLDCPKKRIKEYILGIPHLDIFSSDLLPVMNYAN